MLDYKNLQYSQGEQLLELYNLRYAQNSTKQV
jgi:hypothetical protein